MPNLLAKSISVNGQPLTFFHPENDDSVYGTMSCLRENKFRLDEVPFAPGDVVVDMGSNIGLVSLVLARINPSLRIYAFDASKLAIECLRRSCAVNGITNIESFHLAVGAEDQRDVVFFSNGKDVSCLVEQGLNSSNPVQDNKVNKMGIETLFDSVVFGIDKVRYMKSDIEGAEHYLFRHLFEKRPDILDRIEYVHLEVHPYEHLDPEGLRAKMQERFGAKLFLET